eukprot:g7625.t1
MTTASTIHTLRTVCVFCGASSGVRQSYTEAAIALGEAFACRNLKLVYGGGSVGLMGSLAKSLINRQGVESVIGIIPHHFTPIEINGECLGNTICVDTMHERKMLMHEMSDAFIALPGGLGTLDELIEVLTWLSIDLHAKPIGLLNVQSYYDKLIEFLDFQIEEGFVAQRIRDLLIVADTAEELITKIEDALTKN